MPRVTKGSQHDQHEIEEIDNNLIQESANDEEESSSEQEVYIQPQPCAQKDFPSMFMTYVEGPKWTGLSVMSLQ